MIQIALDRRAERRNAVVAEREPELQRAKTAGKLHGLFEEGESFDRIGTELLCIVAGISEGLAGNVDIAVEETSAIERLIKPLVRIERKRIGFRQAPEFVRCGQRGEGPVGAVDVEPRIVRACDRSDFM